MSMDTEEMVRAQPMDAVVLMGGCDKTVPAQLMGAVSAAKPAIMLVAGPMMTGRYRGERLAACTDCRRFWAQYRAGTMDVSRRPPAPAPSWAPLRPWPASPKRSA
jgi:dihydroxy-acid dehydratase